MGDLWDRLIDAFTTRYGSTSCDVTWRDLTLGTRDAETGWKTKTYTESTQKAILVARGDTKQELPPGAFVRSDWLGLLPPDLTPRVYDQLQSGDLYLEVEAVRPRHVTPDTVEYYEVDLQVVPFVAEPTLLVGLPYELPFELIS